jgi:hypothetical protein
MKRTAWAFCGCLTLFLFALTFQESLAGVVIEQMMKDMEGRASKVVLYYAEEKFRTDDGEKGLTTIIDFQGDRMVMIDHRSKHYIQVKFTQWEKEVAERLKKDNLIIKSKRRKITIKNTGETATINGFQTEKVQIFADEELIEENWMTRDVEIKELEKVMEKVARGFSKDFQVEMKEGQEIYEKLRSYGYPILVKDYGMTYGLGGIDVLEVKKMEKRELKDEIFLPPKDYKKIVPEPSKK